MKFLKTILLSSLLLTQATWADSIDLLNKKLSFAKTANADENISPETTAIKEFEKSYGLITTTEATNLNAGDYEWRVVYYPFGSYDKIQLINPHPTLEPLNQRVLQIAKDNVAPLTEQNKQRLQGSFSDEQIKQLSQLKHEIVINFGTFEKDAVIQARKQIRRSIHSHCGYHVKDGETQVRIQVQVNEHGQAMAVYMDMENREFARCLSRHIKRGKYMILNKDGVPVPYSFAIPIHLWK